LIWFRANELKQENQSVDRLLRILIDGAFHSGQELAAALGVSRTSIWKQVQALEARGFDIFAVRGRGYRLSSALELLDEGLIRSSMTTPARAMMSQLEVHGDIDSTNTHLMRRVDDVQRGQVCLSEQQRQGRGRRGRQWLSPFGQNLYASVSWVYDMPPSELSGLTLHIGISVASRLEQQGFEGVRLKWPNDLFVGRHKLGGILLEMSGEMGGGCRIVAGLGLNIHMQSVRESDIDQKWTSLALMQEQSPVSRNRVAGQLVSAVIEGLDSYARQGSRDLVRQWRPYDLVAGEQVELHLPDRVVCGRAAGIDEHGGLLIESEEGLRSYHAGEVSLRMMP
jgi:BirA family biotin operon repressor/biotin-[acetyl-CoA-carboxylase] ligase